MVNATASAIQQKGSLLNTWLCVLINFVHQIWHLVTSGLLQVKMIMKGEAFEWVQEAEVAVRTQLKALTAGNLQVPLGKWQGD